MYHPSRKDGEYEISNVSRKTLEFFTAGINRNMKSNHLYHYTGRAALVNILNSGYLRATQSWHLADGAECRHAIDTLRLIKPSLRNNGLWRSVEKSLLSMPRYVVCFSKVRNDPYQWRKYGEEGTGACIVFDTRKASKNLTNGSWDTFDCEYDQSVQLRTLAQFARDLAKGGNTVVAERMNKFWEWNIQFKREEFFRENEVRYVFTAGQTAEKASECFSDPALEQITSQCARELNHSHPSGLFDEKYRPFEPFTIQSAVSEIILGPRFTATKRYWEHLGGRCKISQI